MDKKLTILFHLSEECISLGEQLAECLKQERTALVEFQMDHLLNANHQKEILLQELKKKREMLRDRIQRDFGVTDNTELFALIPKNYREQWQTQRDTWLRLWEQIHSHAQTNQVFIRHSQRNLSLLLEDLRSVFGENTLYSSAGKKVDPEASGKVLGASY